MMPHRRLQFSLRFALVVVLAFGVALSVWLSKHEADKNQLLQAENASLRAEIRAQLGELEIDDSNRDKLQAIAIPTLDPMTWKWRLYVPAGQTFWINFIIVGVSDTNIPAAGDSCGPLVPGEQIVTVALRKDESATDRWRWIIRCGNLETGPVLEGKLAEWIPRPSNINANFAGYKGQTGAVSHQPLELLRYRSFPFPQPNKPGPTEMSGPADGILIWIREEPAGK